MFDWEYIVVDALAGGLAGLIGGLVAKGFKKPRVARIVRVGCIVLGFSLAQQFAAPLVKDWKLRREIQSGAIEMFGNEEAAAFQVETFLPILRNPKLYERLQALHASTEGAARLRGPGKTGTAELVAAGIARLDREDQAALLDIKRVLAETSPALCAGFWTGEIPAPDFTQGLRKLNGAQQRTWIAVSARALAREIEAQGPAPRISTADSEQASIALAESLSTDEQQALVDATETQPPPAAVACRAFQAVAAGIKHLPADKQVTLMRMMIDPSLVGG